MWWGCSALGVVKDPWCTNDDLRAAV
jgi:hypothetical protein